jgi:hypothetical protein
MYETPPEGELLGRAVVARWLGLCPDQEFKDADGRERESVRNDLARSSRDLAARG